MNNMLPKTPQNARDQFVDQMTRKLLVDWCDQEIQELRLSCNPMPPPNAAQSDPMSAAFDAPYKCKISPYIGHAMSKGWISKDGSKILAAGWATAARFLKR